jgi:hypothetical protein
MAESLTESQWLELRYLDVLLPWLQRGKRRQVSQRKLRLFGVACCRRVWRRLSGELRRQVETAEQHADGLVSDAALKRAWQANIKMEDRSRKRAAVGWLLWGPWCTWKTHAWTTAAVAELLREVVNLPGEEETAQAELLRDLAGNPFRKVAWRPKWAQGGDRQAGKLAESIYEARSFEEMPILADALEDAGCAEAAILEHLRGPGPHTRGCWALDLVLARK